MYLFPASATTAYPDFVYGRCKIWAEKIQTVAGFTIALAQSVKQKAIRFEALSGRDFFILFYFARQNFVSSKKGGGLFIACECLSASFPVFCLFVFHCHLFLCLSLSSLLHIIQIPFVINQPASGYTNWVMASNHRA